MKRYGLMLSLLLAATVALGADWKEKLPKKEDVTDYLQAVSLSIVVDGRLLGSGTLVAREIEGKNINFVLTCAHVVSDLRKVEEVIDPKSGTRRQLVRFRECEISKEFNQEGRKVGSTNMICKLIKFDEDEDVAILRVIGKNYSKDSIVFYPEMDAPKVTTELYHGGSMAGSLGAHSLTPGIIAQVGRILDGVGKGKVFDQTTVVAAPGSSGGLVIRKNDGAYLGVLSIGVRTGDNFNFIIPIRRIHEWAKKAGVEWLIDLNAKTPTEAKLDDMRVEEVGRKFSRASAAPAGEGDDEETGGRVPAKKDKTELHYLTPDF